jgi:hypothetical protein
MFMFHRIVLVILIFISSFSVHAESIIALSDGDGIQKGDKILRISQTKDPSLKEFLDAIDKAKKSNRTSVLLLTLRDDIPKFVAVDIDEITTLFLPISSKLSNCPSSTTYWHNCFGTDNYPSGSRYIGEWKDGKEYGQGIFIWADGEEYIGQWRNGEKHGQGTYTYPSGAKYVGQWRNGEKHGQGTYTYPSGAKYVGQWMNGDSHGQGTYTYSNGDQYVGGYKAGKKHGQGTYTYPSGAKYVGEYQNGVRRGQGTYTYPSGAKIVGEWAKGELNGYAVEYNADGTILKQGIWTDDEFQIAQNTTPPTTDASSEQRKLALLIGNAEYLRGPLDNPVNDARLIGTTLKSLGFEVYIQENADQKTMKRAIRDFGEKLESAGEDAVGFFYFSGHGLQSEGENYLSPIGAEVRSEADIEIEMVSANAILKQMEFARNGLNIVVLDACRTSPYSRGFRSAQNGLATMDAPTGSILAYATAPGTVAYDGRGDNSPYAGALAKAMLMPNTPVETVFKKVRISVINETDEKQVPWESSSLIGEFMFNPD